MIEGELEHQDSMGNQDVIRVGEVQRMTVGTGIVYSEYNPSKTSANHFLQIWLYPGQKALVPDYEHNFFGDPPWGNWRKVVSLTGNQGSLRINQQTSIKDAKVDQRKRLVFEISLTKLIGYNLFREDSGCTILRCGLETVLLSWRKPLIFYLF